MTACPNSIVASGLTLTVGGATKNVGAANPNGCALVTPAAGATLTLAASGVVTATQGTNGWTIAPVAAGNTTMTLSAPNFNSATVNVTVQPATLDVVTF